MKGSFSNKLNEAYLVKDYFAIINGCEIRENDMLDFEIMYGGCSIDAILSFEDSQGFFSGEVQKMSGLEAGGFVRIGFKAALGCGGDFDEHFVITKSKQSTDKKNARLVTLELQDADTVNKKHTFVTKSYDNKKLADTIKEHNKNVVGDKLIKQRDEVIVAHDKEVVQNITIPSNMNYHEFLNRILPKNGYKYVKDKYTSYIVSGQQTEFDKLKKAKDEFEVDAPSQFSFWKIIQYNLEGYDMNSLLSSIPTALWNATGDATIEDDGTSTSNKTLAADHKKSIQKIGPASTKRSDFAIQKINGVKQGLKSNPNLQQYYTVLSNAEKCSIWIPGLNTNRIGFKVKVSFPRPKYLNNHSYDNTFSGEWEVYAVRDKIIKQYFVQELFLRRPGTGV